MIELYLKFILHHFMRSAGSNPVQFRTYLFGQMLTNTCLVSCLILLIWDTQPKTTTGTDREPTIYVYTQSSNTEGS